METRLRLYAIGCGASVAKAQPITPPAPKRHVPVKCVNISMLQDSSKMWRETVSDRSKNAYKLICSFVSLIVLLYIQAEMVSCHESFAFHPNAPPN